LTNLEVIQNFIRDDFMRSRISRLTIAWPVSDKNFSSVGIIEIPRISVFLLKKSRPVEEIWQDSVYFPPTTVRTVCRETGTEFEFLPFGECISSVRWEIVTLRRTRKNCEIWALRIKWSKRILLSHFFFWKGVRCCESLVYNWKNSVSKDWLRLFGDNFCSRTALAQLVWHIVSCEAKWVQTPTEDRVFSPCRKCI